MSFTRAAAARAAVMAVVAAIAGIVGGGCVFEGGVSLGDPVRIFRTLNDDDTDKWARYWLAKADCDAAAERAVNLAGLLCGDIEGRLGVNPSDYPPRGEEGGEGLLVNEPEAMDGYTLFVVRDGNVVYLLGPLGRIAHTWEFKDVLPPGGVVRKGRLLTNGNLLVTAQAQGARGLIEVDADVNVVWQYDFRTLHHDFIEMPNGNILMLGLGVKTREEAITAGANPEFVAEHGLEYDILIEARPIRPDGGEVVWEWSAWDHIIQDLDPSKENYGAVAEHPELIDINFLIEPISKLRRRRAGDWLHTNAIDYNPELDQVMLSPRNYSELWIIDHSATTEEARGGSGGNSGMGGRLLFRWGNPRSYKRGDADDQRLFWQHQTHWIAPGLPGEGNILLFNNGNEFDGYQRFYSSVDEIEPPVDGYRYRREAGGAYPPADATWTYTADTPTDLYEGGLSGTQRLPNGNTLVTSGNAGTIFQTTPDGRVVWKYVVPPHYHMSMWRDTGAPYERTFGHAEGNPDPLLVDTIYRSYWYAPDYEGLRSLDLTPEGYVEEIPDLIDWARDAVAAGDFGDRLASSDFDIYFDEGKLVYVRERCAEDDTRARFFVNVFPSDMGDLDKAGLERGYNRLEFALSRRGKMADGWCFAAQPLPEYGIERVRTGQLTNAGVAWEAEVELGE